MTSLNASYVMQFNTALLQLLTGCEEFDPSVTSFSKSKKRMLAQMMFGSSFPFKRLRVDFMQALPTVLNTFRNKKCTTLDLTNAQV